MSSGGERCLNIRKANSCCYGNTTTGGGVEIKVFQMYFAGHDTARCVQKCSVEVGTQPSVKGRAEERGAGLATKTGFSLPWKTHHLHCNPHYLGGSFLGVAWGLQWKGELPTLEFLAVRCALADLRTPPMGLCHRPGGEQAAPCNEGRQARGEVKKRWPFPTAPV